MTSLPTTLYTWKQHADFIEFKHYFQFSTPEQQQSIPEKIYTILVDWRENLQEFIAACIEEQTNDFEDTWLYNLPTEYREIIRIEQARRQTHDIVKMLTEQNTELKQQIATLEQNRKNAQIAMKNVVHSLETEMYDSVPLTRQTAINVPYNPTIFTANLARQPANHDDDVPHYFWDNENTYF